MFSFEILKSVADSKSSIFSYRVDIKTIFKKILNDVGVSEMKS